jgi:hypothetical protein
MTSRQIAVLGVILAFTGLMEAKEFCSLVVQLHDRGGSAVETRVNVQDSAGRAVSTQVEGTEARFCNLGILPVTVTVGKEVSCNQVVVKNVPLRWGTTSTLDLIYDRAPCLQDLAPPPKPVCEIMFRIGRSDCKPVSSALIRLEKPNAESVAADPFGRVHIWAEHGTSIRGTVVAQGYEAAYIDTPCDQEHRKQEKSVLLRPSATR